MIKRKLGIISDCIEGEYPTKTLERIKKAGFECFFTGYYQLEDVKKIKNRADELGLEFEFIHAPFSGINNMWLEGDAYLDIFNKMIESIDSAKACGIKTVVTHLSSGWICPEISDVGLARFDKIVARAQEQGITLAFENLRKFGNLAYFTDRYMFNDTVRFCQDIGHEHCYTEYYSWADIFRDRLVCTHIHDNYGRDHTDLTADPDLHLLPFDGNVDYDAFITALNRNNYKGSLMLEVFNDRHKNENHTYKNEFTPDEFIKEAYNRLVKLSKMGK